MSCGCVLLWKRWTGLLCHGYRTRHVVGAVAVLLCCVGRVLSWKQWTGLLCHAYLALSVRRRLCSRVTAAAFCRGSSDGLVVPYPSHHVVGAVTAPRCCGGCVLSRKQCQHRVAKSYQSSKSVRVWLARCKATLSSCTRRRADHSRQSTSKYTNGETCGVRRRHCSEAELGMIALMP